MLHFEEIELCKANNCKMINETACIAGKAVVNNETLNMFIFCIGKGVI